MKNNKPLEYTMTKRMYKEILTFQPEGDKRKPLTFVADYINEHFNLRGTVTKVVVA